jgi:hypothetical protein
VSGIVVRLTDFVKIRVVRISWESVQRLASRFMCRLSADVQRVARIGSRVVQERCGGGSEGVQRLVTTARMTCRAESMAAHGLHTSLAIFRYTLPCMVTLPCGTHVRRTSPDGVLISISSCVVSSDQMVGDYGSTHGLIEVLSRHLNVLKKTTRNISQDSQCSGRDSKRASPGYKSSALRVQPTCPSSPCCFHGDQIQK